MAFDCCPEPFECGGITFEPNLYVNLFGFAPPIAGCHIGWDTVDGRASVTEFSTLENRSYPMRLVAKFEESGGTFGVYVLRNSEHVAFMDFWRQLPPRAPMCRLAT